MLFRVGISIAAALAAAFAAPPAAADDIGAAARGVVRLIVLSEDYMDESNSSLGFGSGFAISPHHIVTNSHVIKETQNPYAETTVAVVPSEGGRPFRGEVVAFDTARDLAIIDVAEARLEPLAIYTGPVESGAHAAALGYPGNVDRATIGSMSDLVTPTAPVRAEGNISSERTVDGTPAFLHTAAISRGNSGGPLVDQCGRVLGVNTYTTVTDSGDAPFGFAVISQELTAFLREHGEKFQQIGTACITMAEHVARERQAQDAANRQLVLAQQRAAQDQQQKMDAAKAAAQDVRENHAVAAGLMALLALVSGVVGAALFLKERTRIAAGSLAISAFALAGCAYAFFSRPGPNIEAPPLTTPGTATPTPVSGKLTCRIKPELSRVTVSTTEDLPIEWTADGCMNGRTQYVEQDGKWRRVLVPNGSETVYVQDFDSAKREYVSTRYLLSQKDMNQLRAIRGEEETKGCKPDGSAIGRLQESTNQLIANLPSSPNEKLVYECQIG